MKIIIQGKSAEGKTTVAIAIKNLLQEQFGATVFYTGADETPEELQRRFEMDDFQKRAEALRGKGLAVELCEQRIAREGIFPNPPTEKSAETGWKNNG